MESTKPTLEKSEVTRETVVSLLRELFDGRPNPDDARPPGPWDPVIREAISRMSGNLTGLYRDDYQYYVKPPKPNWLPAALIRRIPGALGPLPDPWLPGTGQWSASGNFYESPDLASLNPQPLSPSESFAAELANVLVSDVLMRRELLDLFDGSGVDNGRVRDRVSQFVDDWCGTNWAIKWPFPIPRPNWWKEEVSGTELIVMGVQFMRARNRVSGGALKEAFAGAGTKLIETGLARAQQA
jgi:hypothetical protein